MKRSFCCALLLLLSLQSGFARLGETQEEVEKRFGAGKKVNTEGDNTYLMFGFCASLDTGFAKRTAGKTYPNFSCFFYRNHNFDIAVVYFKGKSASERIKKSDDQPLTPSDISKLLEVYGEGKKWDLVMNDAELNEEVWRIKGLGEALFKKPLFITFQADGPTDYIFNLDHKEQQELLKKSSEGIEGF